MTERSTMEFIETTIADDGRLIVSGPIDAHTEPELERAIESWHGEPAIGPRVLDLTSVSLIAAAGIRLLLCTSLRYPDVRVRTNRVVDRVAEICHVRLPVESDPAAADDVPLAAG